jgi:hypothetical protein
VGTGERAQRFDERLAFPSGAAAQRLDGDGLHPCQRILDAMLDLGDQKLLLFLTTPAFGNVSSNLRGAVTPR